jgi:hypothetical protein
MASSTTLETGSVPRWMKRTRLTRFRVFALGVVSLLALLAGITVWRMRDLGDLPDLGDPFDLALARRPVVIANGDNAYEAYARARITPGQPPAEVWDATWNARQGKDTLKWSKSKPAVHEFLEKNRAALEIWREGSERPDALYHQPGELSVETLLSLVQESQLHAAMAALEGSRLEEQGAMDEAWKWYRAMLRSSRLVGRHGVLVERRYGAYLHELAARQIARWASDPRVDAGMLRRAQGDALTADALTWPLSEALKLDYLIVMRDLDEMKFLPSEVPLPGGKEGLLEHVVPPWRTTVRREIQQLRFRASNELERSRRAIRLVYANWLAQVDKPAAERAPSAIYGGLLIYQADRAAPPAARAVAPETLARAIDETLVAKRLVRVDAADRSAFALDYFWERDSAFARERRRRSVLLVKLAAERYRREQGKTPANVGTLVDGCYLKKLPEGVGRNEPIPDGIE